MPTLLESACLNSSSNTFEKHEFIFLFLSENIISTQFKRQGLKKKSRQRVYWDLNPFTLNYRWAMLHQVCIIPTLMNNEAQKIDIIHFGYFHTSVIASGVTQKELEKCVLSWLLQGSRDSMRKYLKAKGQQQIGRWNGLSISLKTMVSPFKKQEIHQWSQREGWKAHHWKCKADKLPNQGDLWHSNKKWGVCWEVLGRRWERRRSAGCADWRHTIRTASDTSFYLHFRPQQNVWCYPWNHIWTEPC